MKVDVLAIGPHPDDVELGIGALIHKLGQRGYKTAILDLTEGEMATRGTVEERRAEASAAAEILGVGARQNACLPDGAVANTSEQRQAVVRFIRDLQPGLILAPMDHDHHPDHEAAHSLVRDAAHLAGLANFDTDQPSHKTSQIYYYRVYGDPTPPSMVVDVSDHFDVKREAMKAHASQLYNPEYEAKETFVSSKAFWDSIETRAAYWGRTIGARFGEPLYALNQLAVDMPPGWEGI
jgi:bacillithiol biosynthesis deacetylase BshB1